MITYFPNLYPDELMYSLFARYYARSGHLAYTFTAEELFENRAIKPSIEFINKLTPDALHQLTRQISMESAIQKHTMLPYYTRFLCRERRQKAFESLLHMDNAYINLICIPKSKDCVMRYLRFCPVCASDDRNQYGEAYWHRVHQMIGINTCPIHGCRLLASDVPITSKGSPALITAEEEIGYDCSTVVYGSGLEQRIARYTANIFIGGMNIDNDVEIGRFLNSRLEYTKYLSRRGEQRYMELLYTDWVHLYQGIDTSITEPWQLQKIFSGRRINTSEICMLAMFLEISEDDLVHMRLPDVSQSEQFDSQIRSLHSQGLNYRQISIEMNASYDVVKAIGEGRY